MNIRQLDYFIEVAHSGSFAKAASDLFVSRQALSKAVRNLEHELGSKLLESHDNRLRLTEFGAELLSEATPVIRAYKNLEQRYARPVVQSPERKTLSVALAHGTSLSLPKLAIDVFRSRHPDILLSIEEVTTQSVIDMVRSKESDIGLVGSAPCYLEEFDIALVVETGVWLYLPDDDPLAQKEALTLDDLDGRPFVTFGKRNHLHRYFMETCEAAGVYPNIVMTTSDTDLLLRSAQEQRAFYFGFPLNMHPRQNGDRKLLPLDMGRDDVFGTYAIKRKDLPLTTSSRAFWNYLLKL